MNVPKDQYKIINYSFGGDWKELKVSWNSTVCPTGIMHYALIKMLLSDIDLGETFKSYKGEYDA